MTTEQIMQTIGCTEEQARELLGHIGAAPKVEQGIVTTTVRTIKHCGTCGRREWHDGDSCIQCGN